MSSIQVIVYNTVPGPILEQRLYYWHQVQPAIIETNTYTIATFRPTKLLVPWLLRQYPDIEPPVVETNPHFLAKHVPAKLYRWPWISWYPDIQPPVQETNTYFIARFRPVVPFVLRALRQNPDIEPPVVETNIHFIAGFRPIRVVLLHSLWRNPDIQPPVKETNTYFIAKFKPVRHDWFKYNHESCDNSFWTASITEAAAATDTVSAANQTGSLTPQRVVRDWWDRDEWGRFIPGAGYRRN